MSAPMELADRLDKMLDAMRVDLKKAREVVTDELPADIRENLHLTGGQARDILNYLDRASRRIDAIAAAESAPVQPDVKGLVDALRRSPHLACCAAAKCRHLPGYTHYEADAGEPCPDYHYSRDKCDCGKDAALAAYEAQSKAEPKA